MTNPDDFQVAKAVSEQLKGLDRDRQERVLRWVSESLALTVPSFERAGPPHNESTALEKPQAGTPGHATNIRSFVDSKDPKSDQQFAAVIAYFYRFEAPQAERRDSISAEQLQEAARLAGRKRLAKPGMTLQNAKNQGYLDTTARGEFRINSVGENLVAMTLPGQGRTRSKKEKSRKPVKKVHR